MLTVGHHNICGRTPSLEEERNIHIADMLQYLGKAYASEGNYEKALDCYKQENKLTYFYSQSYAHLVYTYTQMNNLAEALNVCKKAKETTYYRKTKYYDDLLDEYFTDDTFKTVIDNLYKDTKEKIKNRICLQAY